MEDFLKTGKQYKNWVEREGNFQIHEICPWIRGSSCQKEFCMMWEKGCLIRQGLVKYLKGDEKE
jgi:hypothetical protein